MSSPWLPAAGWSETAARPGDLREDLLQAPHELERSLRALLLLQRMEVAESRRASASRSLTRGLYFIVQEPSG